MIPDPYEKTISIPVRIRNGTFVRLAHHSRVVWTSFPDKEHMVNIKC